MTGNPYTWTRTSRPDSPATRADIWRGDTYVATVTVEPCIPFHASILNRICDAFHADELANRATDTIDLTTRHQLRAVAGFADAVQRRREGGP